MRSVIVRAQSALCKLLSINALAEGLRSGSDEESAAAISKCGGGQAVLVTLKPRSRFRAFNRLSPIRERMGNGAIAMARLAGALLLPVLLPRVYATGATRLSARFKIRGFLSVFATSCALSGRLK